MAKILILNGPNLNMLGIREPEVYGKLTLEEIISGLRSAYTEVVIDHFQSNHEGALVDRIQEAVLQEYQGLVINGGALTHYSYALRDALAMLKCPKIEVHISHIFAREEFRHTSVIAPVCEGMVSGLGTAGYHMAVEWLLKKR